jgi:hypothetical protein
MKYTTDVMDMQSYINGLRDIPTLKEYISMSCSGDVTLFMYLPLTILSVFVYYYEKRKLQKFLREHSEYLI